MSNILDKLDNYIGSDEEQDTLMEDVMDFLSLIDFDDLNEDQIHYLDVLLDHIDEYELNEKTKRVVRGGQLIRKKVCKKGYKAISGKCIKMSGDEKRSRKKGAKKGAKKKKSQGAAIARAKKKSMKKKKVFK